ncbi:MAG: AI-2E family transporter [Nitrospinota bacterium]|nr:AI-2E family transporter [Nitrospinota bacterium]MDH5677509.1 AI-2E family transporter [Nitrospinota bacterium]MDH5755597.1 AI-2E family transporter [Nitrospinota bacterium]
MEEFFRKPWVKALAVVVGIFAGLLLIYAARAALAPFVIAFGLAYLLDPLIDRMETWKIGRTFSILSLFAILSLGALAMATFLIPMALGQVEAVAKNAPVYIERVEAAVAPLMESFAPGEDIRLTEQMKENISSVGQLALSAFRAVVAGIWSGISGAMGVVVALFNLAIIPVATFYLLRDFDRIIAWGASRVPPRHKPKVFTLARRLDSVLAAFVRGQLMVAFIMAVILSLGLLVIGVPMGFFLGGAAGLANIVPFMPLFVGYLPAMALVYADGGGMGGFIAVSVLFGVSQALEGFLITPKIQGDAVGLHPVAIMAAMLVGGVFFGFIGVLLAAPAAAMIKVLLEDIDQGYMESSFFMEQSPQKAPVPPEPKES